MQQTKSTLNGVVQSPADQFEEIELTISKAKAMVAKRDNLMRLAKNKHFKELFLEGYKIEEASRLVQISGEIQHKEHREEIMDAIKGISHWSQYMDTILRLGDMAEESIREHEQVLAEMEAEEEAGL